MAFDEKTRNRLQNFVSSARNLLTEEFTRQLQNDYGLDPTTGEVSDIAALTFLDDTRRQTAHLLRDVLDHYQASNPSTEIRESLERIVREQAFTVLNRLCALKMAEARDILIESISNGYNSKGFQLYSRLAGTAHGEIGDAYRSYLFSLCDEFAVDLAVLFDRYSPMGRLFPKESVLLDLLEKINDVQKKWLWDEDETIGWIYQYWNERSEIEKMRSASRSPQNSNELAVRNQFFTPRYVVEFLTDNTLGRIWYEMTQGNTKLIKTCRYMVRRPNEIFLSKNEESPEIKNNTDNSNQEELLNQPVYIAHRSLKDPREIRMLDPACGSMHFGLYAYDLFEQIYLESWELEKQIGIDCFERKEGYQPLTNIYDNRENLQRDIPRLIIESNIYGVDIDPRAVQIAGLSLWLRAQRTWKKQSIKAVDRPSICKSNIVCAEPMPGEKDLLRDFTKNLRPAVLGQLLEIIFEKMTLAAEAGSLLKIEEEIEDAIEEAREEFNKEILRRKQASGSLFPELEKPKQSSLFDFADLPDKTHFWETVEKKIEKELRLYSEYAEVSDSALKRLFAKDAAKGFAFIDLNRIRYDVVLMNPPFGEISVSSKRYLESRYPSTKGDILAHFIERFIDKLTPSGKLGAITSRTCFFLGTMSGLRTDILNKRGFVEYLADLGDGVLEAMVETACHILSNESNSDSSIFFRCLIDNDKENSLASKVKEACKGKLLNNTFCISPSIFNSLSGAPYCYWISSAIIDKISKLPSLEPEGALVKVGMQTGYDFRFLRNFWEVPSQQIYNRNWIPYTKTDEAIPWYSPIHMVVKWDDDGHEIKNFVDRKGKPRSAVRSPDLYGKPGFSYMLRSTRVVPYVVPRNCIPTAGRSQVFPLSGYEDDVLALCASNLGSAIARFRGEMFARPKFQASMIKELPFQKLSKENTSKLRSFMSKKVDDARKIYSSIEPFYEFICCKNLNYSINQDISFRSFLGEENEQIMANEYGITKDELVDLEHDLQEAVSLRSAERNNNNDENVNGKLDAADRFCSYLVGCVYGRWNIRYATGEISRPELSDPFTPLPVCPIGSLKDKHGLPAEPKDVPEDYPLNVFWEGILVSEKGNKADIVENVRSAIKIIWEDKYEDVEEKIYKSLKIQSLREYIENPNKFFADHLNCYTRGGRQSPIYLPISTNSGSYTIWLYYHRLTGQILYKCVNDFIDLKIKEVDDTCSKLLRIVNRNPSEEKRLEKFSGFLSELKDFRSDLLAVAKLWKPNLNDGVEITTAPLWRFIPHKPWQKKLKQTWEKMEKGDFDWAHLSYRIWPKRVIRASHKDHSYAIAHNLESDLWDETKIAIDRQGNPKYKWMPKELSESEMQQLIKRKTEEL